METGNSRALDASRDTAAMPEEREEEKILEVMVVTVADPVKIGLVAREEVQCEVLETAQEMALEGRNRDAWVTNDGIIVATTGILPESEGAMCLNCHQTTGTRG